MSVDSNSFAEELQDHTAYPRLCPEVLNSENYTFCPWATSVTGWDVNLEKYVLVAVTCKRWGCHYCATRKVRRLAWMCKNAEPTKLLTLTQSTKDWQRADGRGVDGKACWEKTAKAFPELIRFIRKNRGACEYMRVLELTQQGLPHFHCLLRCGFVPQRELLTEWRRLTGVAGVNIKAIDKSFATFRYLVKYLTKLHKIEWTDRHVSYSRDFFRPEDKEEIAYAKLDSIEKYDSHPWVWLQERLGWEMIGCLGEGKWLVGDTIPCQEIEVDPSTLGLPGGAPSQPPPTRTQKLMPGMEDAKIPEYF